MACVKSGPLISVSSLITMYKYHTYTHTQRRVCARGHNESDVYLRAA